MTDRQAIVIAQCTDKKQKGTYSAKELYMPSELFQAQRRYAEAYADEWYILSAKYGLIKPWRRISRYDMTIDEQFNEIWQEQVDNTIRKFKNEKVVIIAGGDYLQRLQWYLNEHDVDYTVPFDGQRYGERVKNMLQEARKVENRQLTSYA